VVGKSVSHHHRHSSWPRTLLWRVYSDTSMMEMDMAMGVNWHTAVMEMDWTMGSMYYGDSGVDRISSHIILSYKKYTLYLSWLLLLLVLPGICRSTQVHGSSQSGSIISSCSLCTLLKPEPLIPKNLLCISWEVWWSVDDGLTAF